MDNIFSVSERRTEIASLLSDAVRQLDSERNLRHRANQLSPHLNGDQRERLLSLINSAVAGWNK